MVKIVMVSAKVATLDLLKTKVILKKTLSHHVMERHNIVDVAM